MYKVIVVEDETMVRRGIILTIDWAALDCVLPTGRRGQSWRSACPRI